MKKVLLVLLLGASFAALAGGGWTQKKGEGFFLLSQRMIAGNGYYNSQGIVIGSPQLIASTTNFYGEYGFSNKLTGLIFTPFVTALSREGGTDNLGNIFMEDQAVGFGDLDVGAKYQFLNKKIKLAGTLMLGLPTGNYRAGETGTLHLGDGEFSQMVRLDASAGLKWGFFTTVFGAFNNRNWGFSDEFHYGGEFGWSKNRLTAIVKLYVRNSLFNEPRQDSPIPGIYSDNLEYFAYGPQILFRVTEKVGISAEMATAASSRNIIAARSYALGIYYELKN